MLVTVCENIGITFSRAVVMYKVTEGIDCANCSLRGFYWEPRTRKHCFFASFLHKIDRTAANQIRCRGQIFVPRRTKKRRRRRRGTRRPSVFFLLCSKDSSEKVVKKNEKKGRTALKRIGRKRKLVSLRVFEQREDGLPPNTRAHLVEVNRA